MKLSIQRSLHFSLVNYRGCVLGIPLLAKLCVPLKLALWTQGVITDVAHRSSP